MTTELSESETSWTLLLNGWRIGTWHRRKIPNGCEIYVRVHFPIHAVKGENMRRAQTNLGHIHTCLEFNIKSLWRFSFCVLFCFSEQDKLKDWPLNPLSMTLSSYLFESHLITSFQICTSWLLVVLHWGTNLHPTSLIFRVDSSLHQEQHCFVSSVCPAQSAEAALTIPSQILPCNNPNVWLLEI